MAEGDPRMTTAPGRAAEADPARSRGLRPPATAPALLLALFSGAVIAVTAAARISETAAPLGRNPASEALKQAESSFHENWPRFRGPDGNGLASAGDWPVRWDAETGENILWKTPVPTPGNSSPILWGDRLFLTGATADRQELLCFDRASGRLLWQTPIAAPHEGVKPAQVAVLPETGYASPTAATDGERVFATFASADIAAVDFNGRRLWSRNLGKPESAYGRATSLLAHNGKVIVQFDRGAEPGEGLSALIALDVKTGRTVWSTPRPVRSCWCTPVLATAGGRVELIANGSPWIMGYDADSGRELWRCAGMGNDVAASPTFADGLVYVTNENARVFAIRPPPEERGDVTKTNIVWSAEDGMSDASSPVADGRFFLQGHSSGRITCYDAASGKLLWDQVVGAAIWASPTIAGGRAYFPGDDGKVYIFTLSGKAVAPATCNLGESLRATPAFADGRIYFRGAAHLFCIGAPGRK